MEDFNADEDEEESDEDEDDGDLYPIKQADLLHQPESQIRNWLKLHGKSKYIDFKDEERQLLRGYFNSLDDDDSGQIGVDELEDPLIALGLVDNRQQVQRMV